ncbi:ABC transporter substrate-binding protein [Bordetella hinzii]|uniref:ABC transporter substrate-binding protein n=1 Tax=Bordetella hinzii TaxID=103855 RepID=UPI00045AAB19|nr:ABC transporter substrate-binding protein [Bordetella hinzii]KCB47483.1 oligopeptide ABC transporter, oligopeptide-binding protein [Bordetella hinzii 4161]KXA72672.1 ABC transporter substrate-binding protein [Bordetella hinzii LMG 13501]QDJ36888.1 ABC transporter substrate-binding protein [Bordetella hinzii]QDJ54912.1 ABC transporter substrate-binding protein [Bordetella hinzii]VEH26787.1 ABC transporter substrate-binding protein [Bordetella hinzii]
MKRFLILALAALVLAGAQARAADAICYNCPPEWADWASALKAIKEKTGITVPGDNKNSGQALASLAAERKNPVADVVYYGVSFGIQAAKDGLVQAYKPAHWDQIPAGMKDADGKWFAIHSGTLGFMVNVDALGGKPVPASWADLLQPAYRGMVGYLDPASAFVGYVGAVAVNQALGGSLDDFGPGIAWFKKMQQNKPIVPKQTAYARVLSGEIPILVDYDFNAYRAKYKDGANVVFVIPAEGTVAVPYVMSLVNDAPHAANGRRVLDFTLSDEGQAIWARAYLRPVRAATVPPEVQARFLPASEYARAGTVDYGKMAEAQRGFSERYAKEVQ